MFYSNVSLHMRLFYMNNLNQQILEQELTEAQVGRSHKEDLKPTPLQNIQPLERK